MVHFEPFNVEQWMLEWEDKTTTDISETCADSISLQQLGDYSAKAGLPPLEQTDFFTRRIGYSPPIGSDELRCNILKLYHNANLTKDHVIITQGAIGANFLIFLAFIGPGDHVVCVQPTYQQLYEVPKRFGAEVSFWKLTPEMDWKHDLKTLEPLITNQTRMLILNNPNNPTGQILTTSQLKSIMEMVKQKASPDCIVLCDEVYRPLNHSVDMATSSEKDYLSILDLGYDNVISTGSLSKAWSLAGLRLGWICTPRKDWIHPLIMRRDYSVISCSVVNDHLASRALADGVREQIHERNMTLARTNHRILKEWILSCPIEWGIRWSEPVAGTTALIYLGDGVDDKEFADTLCEKTGVRVVPAGFCFDQPGWLRIGYCNSQANLERGLSEMRALLQSVKTISND